MVLHGDHHALHRHAELVRGHRHDPQVRLVRHQPVDVGGGEPGAVERRGAGLGELDHRVLEDLLARPSSRRRRCRSRTGRRRRRAGRGSGRRNAGRWRGCRGPPACRRPRPPRGSARRRRRRTARRSTRSVKSRMREKVSAPITITRRAEPARISASAWASAKTKPAQTACMSKAKPPRMPMALCTLTAVDGKGLVGGRGGDDQRVDVGAGQAGVGERGARGGDREVGGHLALGGEVPALDAGAGADPLVGGVEGARELGVLDDPRRQVVAAAARHRAQDAHDGRPPRATSRVRLRRADRDPGGEPLR